MWLKIDAADIEPAILESRRGIWNGDIDYGDGRLQELRTHYEGRKLTIEHLRSQQSPTIQLLADLSSEITKDVQWLQDRLTDAIARQQV